MNRLPSLPARPWSTGAIALLLLAAFAHSIMAPPLRAWWQLSEIEARLETTRSRLSTLAMEREPLYRPADLAFARGDFRTIEEHAEARLLQLLNNAGTVELTTVGAETAFGDFGQGITQLTVTSDILALEQMLNTLANSSPGLRIHALHVEDQGQRPGERMQANVALHWLWANPDLEEALAPVNLADGLGSDDLWRSLPPTDIIEITWSDRLPFEPTHSRYTPPAPPLAPIQMSLLGISSRDGTLVARLSIDGEETDVVQGDTTPLGVVERVDIDAIILRGDEEQRLSLFGD